MVSDASVIRVKVHTEEIVSIISLNDKAFRKFYRLYTGEKVSVDETNEARLILVKMLANLIVNDIEEVLKNEDLEMQNEESFFDSVDE